MSRKKAKLINLALQGAGAHGAFTWGVLDRLVEEERLEIEAITAASAGAMNAVVLASGLAIGGVEKAKRDLEKFWRKVSNFARLSPLQPTVIDKLMTGGMQFQAMQFMAKAFSPYQFNAFGINPFKDILKEVVNFDALRGAKTKVYVNATNVLTGKVQLFYSEEMDVDMVLASACIPFVFKTVEIDGQYYWDGGYTGNPSLYPIFYNSASSDILLVQINPISIEEVPSKASDIIDRVNEISFNSILMQEMRAINFVSKLLEDHKIESRKYKNILMHLISAEEMVLSLGRNSKLNADWDFLCYLRDSGRQAAEEWLDQNFDNVGVKSTVDIKEKFL